MTTLSYGYKRPATGDKGSVWFPALEDNITRLNGHNHDGSNSVALTPVAVTKFTSTISAASWVDDGGGNYSYVVTVPAGISGASSPFNDNKYYNMIILDSATKDRLHLGIEWETATTFTVRCNDNTLDVIIYYS